MIKAIAIDDEPMALSIVRNFSAKVPFIDLRETFTDALNALPYLQNEKPDLVFLDIKMPDISGIDWAKSLNNPPMIIFTTAYSEYAIESFELNTIDYLLKPFSFERFLKAVNKANTQYQLRQQTTDLGFIFIKSGSDQVKIWLDQIQFVQSAGNYVQFILKDHKILSRLTMNEAVASLPTDDFIKVHRSYIVSKNKITRLDKQQVWIDGQNIPIGAGYFEELNKIVNK